MTGGDRCPIKTCSGVEIMKDSRIKPFLKVHPQGTESSTSVSPFIVYGPEADALVLGACCQEPLPGVLVVREGHAEHHVGVVLQHCKRPQPLPAEHAHAMVPASRRKEFTVSTDTQLGDPRVDQSHRVLKLQQQSQRQCVRSGSPTWPPSLYSQCK